MYFAVQSICYLTGVLKERDVWEVNVLMVHCALHRFVMFGQQTAALRTARGCGQGVSICNSWRPLMARVLRTQHMMHSCILLSHPRYAVALCASSDKNNFATTGTTFDACIFYSMLIINGFLRRRTDVSRNL